MPALTSLGIGSGLDLNGMLTQLVALERKPLEPIRAEATRLQTKISTVATAKSLMADVQDAAAALNRGSLWGPAATSTLTATEETAIAAAVKEAVNRFAQAYNALASHLHEQTQYDAANQRGAPLQGDGSISLVMQRLRNAVGEASSATGTNTRWSDLGLRLQSNGKFTVDNARLEAAVSGSTRIQTQATLTNPSTGTADYGLARRMGDLAANLLGSSGALSLRHEGLQRQLDRNGDNQQRVLDRVARTQERLTREFSAMDSRLSKLSALNSYVSNQMAALANGSK